MKNIIIKLSAVAIILLSFLLSIKAYAADTPNPAQDDFSKDPIEDLITEAKKKNNKFLAHDMYLDIYKQINSEPDKNAIKNLAQKNGLSEEEATNLVKKGDISSLTKQKGVTQDEAAAKYASFMNAYNTELESQKMQTELLSNIKPSELYADNNTSNSDFDVIYDLTVIETLLFNETSGTNGFGGTFVMPPINLVSSEEATLKELIQETYQPNKDEEYVSVPEKDKTGSQTATGETKEDTIDPLSCNENENDISKSLQKFESEAANKQAAEGKGPASAGEGTDAGAQAGQDLAAQGQDQFPSAPADDWSMKELCPDGAFFCLDIDFVMKQAALSKTTSGLLNKNCTKCHVDGIIKALDSTLSKPLSSNKVTGNIMEMPKCKNSLTNIGANMNIVTIAVPVPQTTSTFNAKIEQEWRKFLERTGAYGYQKTPEAQQKAITQPAKSVEEQSAKYAVTVGDNNQTALDAATKTIQAANIKNAEVTKTAETQSNEKLSEKRNRFYQSIMKEFNTMNIYFSGMKDNIEKMKVPCQDLSNKQACS